MGEVLWGVVIGGLIAMATQFLGSVWTARAQRRQAEADRLFEILEEVVPAHANFVSAVMVSERNRAVAPEVQKLHSTVAESLLRLKYVTAHRGLWAAAAPVIQESTLLMTSVEDGVRQGKPPRSLVDLGDHYGRIEPVIDAANEVIHGKWRSRRRSLRAGTAGND